MWSIAWSFPARTVVRIPRITRCMRGGLCLPSVRGAPTVVLLHSLGIRRPELEMGLARELVRNGIAVFLMTLPYHMQRTPPGYGSGDLILAGDIALLREAGIQATWDVRRAVDWLQRQPEVDPDRIALVGISLGAILGATALAVEPRLHSAVLILGGADLAHVLWDSILAIRARARLRRDGYTLERLREELAPIEPLNLLTPEHGEKTFVIGARFDIVVPTEDTEKLIRAGQPEGAVAQYGALRRRAGAATALSAGAPAPAGAV